MPRYIEIMQCCQCQSHRMDYRINSNVCEKEHKVISFVNGEDFPVWCPLKKIEDLR